MREEIRKNKRVPDGAYAKGQTNLDGDMVVEERMETVAVQKGEKRRGRHRKPEAALVFSDIAHSGRHRHCRI